MIHLSESVLGKAQLGEASVGDLVCKIYGRDRSKSAPYKRV